MSEVLVVDQLNKRFGGLQAISDLSFEVGEGEIVGLIGPNGAGKTTLFNVIDGVYRPDSGRILFRGRDVTGLPPYTMARLGMGRTHQVVRPLNELTVRQNVMVGACFGRRDLELREAAARADAVLVDVGLSARADQLATTLNVAQKKRLELARALASDPYLLLLDEVLAGLNQTEITAMLDTVREIRQSGVTIILIEHVMHAVMSISDRVIALDYGKRIASGTPSEVSQDTAVIEAYLGDPKVAAGLGRRR